MSPDHYCHRLRAGASRLGVLVFAAVCCFSLAAGAQPAVEDLHSPEARYQFAEGLFFRKFYDLAEKEFRVFVTKYPEHELAPDAMYRLIISLRNQGKKDETLSAINQFQARWPHHDLTPKLFLWKGELLFEREKYAAAEHCFKRLVPSQEVKTREAGLFYMAQCQEKQGNVEEALATYSQLSDKPFEEEFQYRPYAVFAIGLANQRRGLNEEAGEAFARLVEGDTVPKGVREEALYRLAETRFAREMYAEAVKAYEQSLAEFPRGAFAREARKRLCWAHYLQTNYARAAEVAGEWRDLYGDVFDPELTYIHAASLVGVEFYEAALPMLQGLADHPDVPPHTQRLASYQIVICLANLGRREAVVESAEAFVEGFPKAAELPTVRYLAGRAYHGMGQHSRAIPELRRSLEGFIGEWPYYADAVRLLTESLEEEERYKEAADVYREASTREDLADRAFLLFKAGECSRKAGDEEAAIRDFEALLTGFPGAVQEARAAMQHLGELYSSSGDFDRAAGIIETLIEQADAGQGNGRFLFFLGYLRYQQDEYERAVKRLREALKEPDAGAVKASATFYLGGALLELERTDEALDVFGELLAMPESERPEFPADLLFQLDELYYARHQYSVSESICRWLMTRNDGRTVYRAALRLADILAAQGRLEEAESRLADLRERLNTGDLAFQKEPDRPLTAEVASVQSEIFLLQGKLAKAIITAEECLAEEDLSEAFVTRARWVMGEAFFRQGPLEEAFPYAVKVYILADDPVYSPRAMLLAIRILVAQEKLLEASRTWQELRKRYPVYAESTSSRPAVKTVIEFAGSDAAQPPGEGDAGQQDQP